MPAHFLLGLPEGKKKAGNARNMNHNWFLLVLLQRVRNKSPNVPLSCPECRQQTNIFDVDALPKNVFLIRLLDQLIIKPTNGSNEQQISTPKATTTSVNNKTIELDKQQTAPVLKPQGEMQQQQATVPYAKALYDFKMNPIEDEGCLKFQKGMIIHVTRRVDQNWAEGKLGEAVGIFPLSFVQMNQAASSLMQSYANKWRLPVSLNSTANNEQSPSTSTSPQRQLQPPPPVLQPTPAPPNLTRPKSVPSNSQTTTTTTQQFCSQISSDKTGTYIALHNYSPQKPDELELKKGSQYIVKEACQDGWLKGCCSDNLFKKGVFPGNYVMPMVYHQMMEMQRNLALKAMQAQKNQPNSNTQPMRTTGYTNHGLSSIPPELPQRNITAGVVATRSSQSPLSIMNKAEAPTDSSTAQTQKTDDNVNKQKKESVTEMLMKRLGYNRKSNDSSAYSIDNPVFEDSSTTSVQPLHMRSGSCPIDLGAANVNIENLQFGSQRVKTRERCALTT